MKIHLVMGKGGCDESDWPVKAFRSKERATRFAEECTAHAAKGCPEYDAWLFSSDDTDKGMADAESALAGWQAASPDQSGDMREQARYVVRELDLDEEVEG